MTETRTPPHDLAAERAVLGAMMQSPDAIADVTPILRPGDHYRPAHTVIHEAILALEARGEPVDWVTVADALGKQGDLARVGGPTALHDCLEAVPTAAMAGHYARIVAAKASLRRQVEAGIRITDMAYAGEGDATELAARARREVDAILPDAPGSTQGIGDLFYEVLDSLESAAPRGLPLPWIDLNYALNGLGDGEMVVIAARPGTGKSITGLQACAHVALHEGEPAVIFSMEMSRQEILLRLISAEARVPFHALMGRQLTSEHWQRITAVEDKITAAPLVIDDTPGCSLAYARAQLRAMRRTRPARLACFDYLQLLTGGKGENRQAEVSANARGIKHLAAEFDIPVIAISQLNRGPAQDRKSVV